MPEPRAPLLLDGALATELRRRGFELEAPLFAARALLEAPDLLVEIHRDYALAGAQVLSTNSFGLHAATLARAGLAERQVELAARSVELTFLARQLLRQSGSERTTFRVAASVPPPPPLPSEGDAPELTRAALRSLASALVDAGADLVLFETFSKPAHIRAALEVAGALELPAWLSVVGDARPGHRGQLLGGVPFDALAALLREPGLRRPDALLLNCTQIDAVPQALEALLQTARAAGLEGVDLGLYPHLGRARHDGEWIDRILEAEVYAGQIEAWMAARPALSIAGACCGSTPAYVEALARRLHPDAATRERANVRLAQRLP